MSDAACKTHPDAPHGFDRNGSHNAGRYVCECESWEPPSDAATDDPLELDMRLPDMPLASLHPAYGAKFNWADMRIFAAKAARMYAPRVPVEFGEL